MEKLVYITNDGWWDSDVNVFSNLSKSYHIEVIVLSRAKSHENKYPIKEVPQGAIIHNFSFGRAQKDIRMPFCSLFYSFYLLFKAQGNLTFWVYEGLQVHSLIFTLFACKSSTIVSFHNYKEHVDSHWYSSMMQKITLSLFKFFHFQSPSQELLFKKDFPQKVSFSTTMPPKNFGKPKIKKQYFNNFLKTFLFFGYIRQYKHVEMFIKAANRFNGKANFIIAGNSKDWDKYQKLINKESSMLCHIRYIDNTEIPNYYCQSHFIVLPYEDSTQSGPLLIAYNYGLPAIVSDLPYFKQMIDDKVTGFVFKNGDQISLNKCIENAIDLSAQQYNAMRVNLKFHVEEYRRASDFAMSLTKFVSNHMIDNNHNK